MKTLEAYKKNPTLIGSPLMCAVFEALAGIPSEERVVDEHLSGISFTSDGYAVSASHFLGSAEDVERNIRGLCAHFEDDDFADALLSKITDWRPGGNAWK